MFLYQSNTSSGSLDCVLDQGRANEAAVAQWVELLGGSIPRLFLSMCWSALKEDTEPLITPDMCRCREKKNVALYRGPCQVNVI